MEDSSRLYRAVSSCVYRQPRVDSLNHSDMEGLNRNPLDRLIRLQRYGTALLPDLERGLINSAITMRRSFAVVSGILRPRLVSCWYSNHHEDAMEGKEIANFPF